MVFEFAEDVPGYRIGYIERPVTEDGSGREVAVRGGAVLEAHFEAASAVRMEGESAKETYKGPRRLSVNTTTIVDAVSTGDFEANLNWAVGVVDRRPFTVTTLTAPSRVVIDIF